MVCWTDFSNDLIPFVDHDFSLSGKIFSKWESFDPSFLDQINVRSLARFSFI